MGRRMAEDCGGAIVSKLTGSDIERLGKWCERPDGAVPYNAICRLFDDYEALRAQRDELAQLLYAMVENEDAECRHDGGGYCYSHAHDHQLDGCRVAAARAALAKLEVKNG